MSKSSDFPFRPLSHSERCRSSQYNNVHVDKSLCNVHEVHSVEDYVQDNRVLKRSVVKTYDPRENFARYKASDFALENIIAAGAVDMLKDCGTLRHTPFEVADSLEQVLDSMPASAPVQNETTNE